MDTYDPFASLGIHTTTLMPKFEEQTFLEFKVARAISIYGLPILILVGTISNIISLVVLRCKTFRSSSVSFGLIVLSVINLGILYVVVLRQWVLELMDRTFDFRVTSFGCKIQVMLTYLLCHLSSWTLVMIVLERTFIVCFPLAAKPYCSRRNTMIIWSMIAAALFLVNCHFLWTFDYIPDPLKFSYFEIKPSEEPVIVHPKIFRMMDAEDLLNTTSETTPAELTIIHLSNITEKVYQKTCYAHIEYFHFYHVVWPWIDALVISFIPFILLLFGNLSIVITIARAVKFRNESATRCLSTTSNKISRVSAEPSKSSELGTMDRKVCTLQRLREDNFRILSRSGESSSTYMLLGASFLFLFLTTPSSIYLILSDYLITADSSPQSFAKYRLCFSVTVFLYFLNNSINFFIYYLTGSRFRKTFKSLLNKKKQMGSEGRLSEIGTKTTKLKTLPH